MTDARPLVAAVMDRAVEQPAAVAVIDQHGRTLTYGELRRRVFAVATALAAHGLAPGDAVFFAVRPGPDALVLGLAVAAAGGVVVVADPGAGDELFCARAELVRAGSGRLWTAAESVLYAVAARRSLRDAAGRRGLLLPDFAALGGARHISTGRWLPGVPRHALSLARLATGLVGELPQTAAGLPAVVVFTSGTTAAPRAVVHTQATLGAGCQLFRERLAFGPGDVLHADQLMIALPALTAGATWSLSGLPLRPGRVLTHLRRRAVSHLFGTPADLATILDEAQRRGTGLPQSVRCVMLGAAPVPPASMRRVAPPAPGAEVLSIYGTTEALPIAIATAEEKLTHIKASGGDLLGRPLPDVSARISGDGELMVRGPQVAVGYLGERPLIELATGDVATLAADGGLVLLGRAKDMLIRGSFNLYPGLYEPAIAALPGVADAAYVGIPDPATGDEAVVLAVVPLPGQDGPALARRLKAELPKTIDTAACPDRIEPVPAIARRGRTGKPDRAALRALLSTLETGD